MDTNPISSLLDNLRQKFTNPFLGTFILVWIVHNWRLVFSFFNFDERTNLERKMKVISYYYDSAFSIENLAVSAAITLGVLIASFIGINIARIIVETSERIIKPAILKIASSSKVVERKDLEAVEDALKVWVGKHAKEVTEKNTIQNQYDDLVAKNKNLMASNVTFPGTGTDTGMDTGMDTEIQKNYINLKKQGLIKEIWENISDIVSGKIIVKSKALEAMLMMEFVEFQESESSGNIYKLTNKGQTFREYINSQIINDGDTR